MKIVVGSDHGGFYLKEILREYLQSKEFEIIDVGCYEEKRCDYPDIAEKAALLIQEEKADIGVLVCGTGTGMCMVANKFKGIRASLCSDSFSARLAKEHDNANIICFGGRVSGSEIAKDMLDSYLNAEFMGGRHLDRINKINEIEKRNYVVTK